MCVEALLALLRGFLPAARAEQESQLTKIFLHSFAFKLNIEKNRIFISNDQSQSQLALPSLAKHLVAASIMLGLTPRNIFALACLYNFLIVIFSKGFTNNLGTIDSLFDKVRCQERETFS